MADFHLHLISDATGETLNSVARACLVQFDKADAQEHLWPLVRTAKQLDRVLTEIEHDPGIVLYTIVDAGLRTLLEKECHERKIPHIAVLDPVLEAMANYFGMRSAGRPGRQHKLDEEYFDRIDAMNFVMTHDDGQATNNLKEAEVILVGVSRTSKTPTCIYLANRGIKAANVPIVPDCPLPPELFEKEGHALVIGLTENPARLAQIRRHRMEMLANEGDTDYTDLNRIKEEVAFAQRLFRDNNWPVLDVTRRSIEETAAAVMQLVQQRGRGRASTKPAGELATNSEVETK